MRFASLSLILLAACVVPDDPNGSRGGDMTLGGGTQTFDLLQVDLTQQPGSLGAGCTQDTDCKVGAAPKCWAQNVYDDPGEVATPGGYCTAPCTMDADCKGQGLCATVVTGRAKYCVESCKAAGTCRDKYACYVYGPGSGYCYPKGNVLICNPTVGDGTCPDGRACIRRAFDDLGECRDTCRLGPTETCPIIPKTMAKQHCIYINATRDTQGRMTTDKYQGTACFPISADARQEGAGCAYFDDCQSLLQCNLTKGGDSKCHYLCVIPAMADPGACADPLQSCKDVFGAGVGKPGLCL